MTLIKCHKEVFEQKHLSNNFLPQSLQWQSLTHPQGCLLYQTVANTFICRLQVSKFIDRILIQKKIITTPTRDGKNNENIAKNMYRKKRKYHVHECRLLVHPAFSFIAATPEGKICANGQSGILEIKCPFSIRDK